MGSKKENEKDGKRGKPESAETSNTLEKLETLLKQMTSGMSGGSSGLKFRSDAQLMEIWSKWLDGQSVSVREAVKKRGLDPVQKYALRGQETKAPYLRILDVACVLRFSDDAKGQLPDVNVQALLVTFAGNEQLAVMEVSAEALVPYPFTSTNPPSAEELAKEATVLANVTLMRNAVLRGASNGADGGVTVSRTTSGEEIITMNAPPELFGLDIKASDDAGDEECPGCELCQPELPDMALRNGKNVRDRNSKKDTWH